MLKYIIFFFRFIGTYNFFSKNFEDICSVASARDVSAERKTADGGRQVQVGRAKVGGLCPNLQITAGHINHGPGFGIARGLNVISRFRFGAPPTFRAGAPRREYSTCVGIVSFCTAAGEKIATKHMLPAVHSIYLATSSADDARREDKRGCGAKGWGKACPRERPLYYPAPIGKVEQ